MKHIVKRKGHSEVYDVRKLYASVYSMCLATQATDEEAEHTADKIVDYVNMWLKKKHEVTAHDIQLVTSRYLTNLNADAGYLYSKHRGMHQ